MDANLLQSSPLLDFKHPSVAALVTTRGWRDLEEGGRIGAIYDFVRNQIAFGYNAADDLPASRVLADGIGQCNTKGTLFMALLSAVVADTQAMLDAFKLPEGYYVSFEGQFQAQREASRLIALLSLASFALVALTLYSRYQSWRLALLILANIPLALIGSVAALWISGQPLSVASLIGFITLAGIAARNGILKVSHYINLCRFEGETFGDRMILRGSEERLAPVLMTALVAAFALAPLMLDAEAPGAEILYPVAVVIFGGLITSTLLDSFITPALFKLYGAKPLACLLAETNAEML